MNDDPILREFLAKGRYETPANLKRSFSDRIWGWSDAWYYLHLYRIVRSGAGIAHRGNYTVEVWQRQSMDSWRAVEACGGKLELSRSEGHELNSDPKVYVCNHMSLLETFLLPGPLVSLGSDVATVVKESLLTYPVFGAIMRAVNPISVSRTNPREDLKTVLSLGKEELDKGRSVLIFPQSTRMSEFDPSLFNTLGAKLADRAGVPVVPVAVKTDFMGVGRLLRDFGPISRDKRVYVKVGKALPISGNARDVHRQTIDFIAGNLRAWGAEPREQ